jgi:murein L,D-transpeptidase YafK
MIKRTIAISIIIALTAILGWANWNMNPLPANKTANRLLVIKSDKTLQLFYNDAHIKTYRVSFGANPNGHKQQEGDERTPEGNYIIDWRNPNSNFHRSLHISYPDSADVAHASASGVSPGGQIMIHGMRKGFGFVGKLHRFINWTDGCIAVTNAEANEIWRAVPNGTPIEIIP